MSITVRPSIVYPSMGSLSFRYFSVQRGGLFFLGIQVIILLPSPREHLSLARPFPCASLVFARVFFILPCSVFLQLGTASSFSFSFLKWFLAPFVRPPSCLIRGGLAFARGDYRCLLLGTHSLVRSLLAFAPQSVPSDLVPSPLVYSFWRSMASQTCSPFPSSLL